MPEGNFSKEVTRIGQMEEDSLTQGGGHDRISQWEWKHGPEKDLLAALFIIKQRDVGKETGKSETSTSEYKSQWPQFRC